MKFFNVPANYNFLESVYCFIQQEFKDKYNIGDLTIFLPSRRSVNELKRIFIAHREVVFLPTIKAIGDIDYDDIILNSVNDRNINNIIELSKPISNIKYKLMLIKKFIDKKYNIQQAITMSDEFDNLLQELEQNNCDINKLDDLIEEDYRYSEHWQKILEFLKNFNLEWKEDLQKQKIISVNSHKNHIIKYYIDNYKSLTELTKPVLIVGNLFTTDNTVELVKNLMKFDNSYLIFKGFEVRNIKQQEQEYYENEININFLFNSLVNRIKLNTNDIKDLRYEKYRTIGDRETEIIVKSTTPNELCYKWREDIDKYNNIDFSHINYVEFRDIYEEIEYIKYYILNHIKHNGAKNIAIITTEQYSNEFEIALKNYIHFDNFKINNSFGYNFIKTQFAQTLFNIINVVDDEYEKNNFEIEDCVKMLYFINDSLLNFNSKNKQNKEILNKILMDKNSYIETTVDMLINGNTTQNTTKIEEIKQAQSVMDEIKQQFGYFLKDGNKKLCDMIEEHLKLVELYLDKQNLTEKQQKEILEITDYLREIQKESFDFTVKNNFEYKNILEYFLSQKSYSETFSSYPAINIIGKEEARLINYDLVVIFNCNEGNFPKHIKPDPWLNNVFRKNFGLYTKSVEIGKDYYDFIQFITQKEILITRSLKDIKTSAITFESRFLQRFKTYLKTIFKTQEETKLIYGKNLLDDAYKNSIIEEQQIKRPVVNIDTTDLFNRIKISATSFETLQKNPYDFYCNKYLKLKDTSFITDESIDTVKGSLIHKIFELYSSNQNRYSNTNELKNLIQTVMNKYFLNSMVNCILYGKEIESLMASFVKIDKNRKNENNYKESMFENNREFRYNNVVLTARVDRIDFFKDFNGKEHIKIVDYKSTSSFYKSQIQKGEKLQLPFEAFIFKNSGFDIDSVEYWKKNKNELKIENISTQEPIGRKSNIEKNIDYILQQIKSIIDITLKDLLENRIFIATNHNEYSHYQHISRVDEWLYG